MNGRRRCIILACGIGLCLLVLCGCPSTPPVIIDTTDVDGVIVDVSDTAGTIEVQTVTVYETVTKLIYQASPEEKALVGKQFGELRASIAHLKTLGPELARVHAVEVGKLASEIARLQPFEVEVGKVKGQRNTAWAILAGLSALVAVAVFLKVKGLLF